VRRARRRIADWLELALEQAVECLELYDAAYGTFTQNRRPHVFREFLLNAPDLFLHLSEKMGALSHSVAVWQRRGRSARTPAARRRPRLPGFCATWRVVSPCRRSLA